MVLQHVANIVQQRGGNRGGAKPHGHFSRMGGLQTVFEDRNRFSEIGAPAARTEQIDQVFNRGANTSCALLVRESTASEL